MTTRYRASWVISEGEQADPQDFDLWAVEYGSRNFDSREKAIAWARAHDLWGEGRVYVEQSTIVHDALGNYVDWEEIETIYCYNDGETEVVSAWF